MLPKLQTAGQLVTLTLEDDHYGYCGHWTDFIWLLFRKKKKTPLIFILQNINWGNDNYWVGVSSSAGE